MDLRQTKSEDNRKLHNEELHNSLSSPHIIKSYKSPVRISEGKVPIRRRKMKDNIKMVYFTSGVVFRKTIMKSAVILVLFWYHCKSGLDSEEPFVVLIRLLLFFFPALTL